MPFTPIIAAAGLWDGDMTARRVDGHEVLLVRLNGVVYAYENRCAHLGGVLSEGRLDGHVLTCRAHHCQYDVRAGRGISPGTDCLRRFAVKIEDGSVFVDVDAPCPDVPNERREREHEMRAAGRLPPGQSLTLKWPVLHVGSVPRFDPRTWDFRVFGLVEQQLRLSWEQFSNLPQSEVLADMHCVTRWSRFDNHWGGLLATELMKRVKLRPEARHVMVHAENKYTANLPILDFLRPTTIFALRHDGEPLTAEHGYPLRLVVPNLYAWKSVKWVRGIELLDRELPGLWEYNGYHIYGDPFKEQRYSS